MRQFVLAVDTARIKPEQAAPEVELAAGSSAQSPWHRDRGHLEYDVADMALYRGEPLHLVASALGVGTKERLKEVDGVPAIAETLPGYVGSTWLGLFAPAGTPQTIVDKIQATIAIIMEEPQLRQRAIQLGMYLVSSKPGEFSVFLKRDALQWANVRQRGCGPLHPHAACASALVERLVVAPFSLGCGVARSPTHAGRSRPTSAVRHSRQASGR